MHELFEAIKIVETYYPGARSGDDTSYELYVNGEQFKWASGATAGRSKEEILVAFLKSVTREFKESRKRYDG